MQEVTLNLKNITEKDTVDSFSLWYCRNDTDDIMANKGKLILLRCINNTQDEHRRVSVHREEKQEIILGAILPKHHHTDSRVAEIQISSGKN
jgi:hypothetical protein